MQGADCFRLEKGGHPLFSFYTREHTMEAEKIDWQPRFPMEEGKARVSNYTILYNDNDKSEEFKGMSGYELIVDVIGEILLEASDNDWTGDSIFLVESRHHTFESGVKRGLIRKGKYGLVIFGWGSCSGCDALQGVQNHEDVNDIYRELLADTRWFGSFRDLKEKVNQFMLVDAGDLDESEDEFRERQQDHYYSDACWWGGTHLGYGLVEDFVTQFNRYVAGKPKFTTQPIRSTQ